MAFKSSVSYRSSHYTDSKVRVQQPLNAEDCEMSSAFLPVSPFTFIHGHEWKSMECRFLVLNRNNIHFLLKTE